MTENTAYAFEATDVTVHYPGAERPALDRVSMCVPAGTLYSILGPNGSGKSTLMKALLGAARTSFGSVRVMGIALAAWNRRDLAKHVGAVSQSEPVTFPIRVEDLVGMGRYPHVGPLRPLTTEDRNAVGQAMSMCDVDTLRHRDVSTLSGGEYQRVRIARALAQQPSCLALDEPTAALDIRHEMAILSLLRTAVDDGMTVVLVTHHLESAARFADRILLLAEGAVAAEGPPGEVLTTEHLSRVYDWPIDVETNRHGFQRVTPLDPPRSR